MEARTLKFSVNPEIIDKNLHGITNLGTGFINVHGSVEDLAKAIDDGWAFSYVFLDEHRKAENFISADILTVDVDHGLTTLEALDLKIVREYCSIFYTTPSHTPDNHRFRLVFVLPKTINNPEEIRAASRALTQRIGGDPAATDPARMFYGSKGSHPLIFDKSISTEFLQELIEDGRIKPSSESVKFHGYTANRSSFKIKSNMTVLTRGGHPTSLQDIEKTTSIYCPFHHDSNPSALASLGKNGDPFIWCSKCQKTWWTEDAKNNAYDFDAFENSVREIHARGVKIPSSKVTPFEEFFGINHIPAKNIHISNNHYFQLADLQDGLSIIKSPKASGKTNYLSSVLRKFVYRHGTLEELEEESSFDYDPPIFTNNNVLLIGHRRALIGELCRRLSLNCYLDDPTDRAAVSDRQKRYGVCLDSLWKVKDKKYDIIVIDEVEQVLSHFLSDTVGESRVAIFQIFSNLISNAKKVVVLDADISWITFTTLTKYVPKASRSNHDQRDVHIYINNRDPVDRSIYLYPSNSQIVQKIKEYALSSKRIFVCSNSKAKINNLEALLNQLAAQTGSKITYKSITSTNSQESTTQEFIKNIKSEILNYQVVLSSPSLGTGIDITFDGNEQKIDAVFGIFENQINSHFEIDQQLSRVRDPKEVHVWVSPSRFQFETEFDVVTADWLDMNLSAHVAPELIASHEQKPGEIDPFLSMVALITSHQRASKNNLRHNFVAYKEHQGFRFIHVDHDDTLEKEGRELYRIGTTIARSNDINNVLNAKTMNQFEYSRFKVRRESNQELIAPQDWFNFFRTRIELFYGQPADRYLIEEDNKGHLRQQVMLFEKLQSISEAEMRFMMDKKSINLSAKLIQDPLTALALLYFILSQTPFYKDGNFDDQATFTKEDLVGFARSCLKLKDYIYTQLEINIRKDVSEKPTQQLGTFLKKIGLSTEVTEIKKVHGGKSYRYRLSAAHLNRIKEIVDHRSDLSRIGWSYVDQQYGFSYTNDEMDMIYGL